MKMRLLLCLFGVLSCYGAQGQMGNPFNQLDLTEITSGVFKPLAPGWVEIPDGSGYGALSFSTARQTIFELERSRVDESLFPQLETLWTDSRTIKQTLYATPIILSEVKYHDFAPNAIDEGLVAIQDGQYVDVSSDNESPYEERLGITCLVDKQTYTSTHQTFVFPSSLFITNFPDDNVIIEVDFDDGVGWRSVLWDEPIQVYYPDMSLDRTIRVNVLRNGESRHAGFNLRSGGGASDFSELDLPPWPTTNNVYKWRIGAEYADLIISGNAYTLMSDDGVFDKPFIFVEGIDFDYDFAPQRYGTFGWYEFSSGQSEQYDFLENTPVLLQSLLDEGYDIVLLDFEDGADYIHRNSALLRHLIGLVNEYKVGDEPNVIVGASMGGQVTRHALRMMELQGEDHCCRLWVSIDSPHKGAYIPASIQQFIDVLSDYSAEANGFITHALQRPAARQLLRYQAFSDMDAYNAWYSILDDLGYPQQTRNVAISNGSLSGWQPDITSGQSILDYNWTFAEQQIVGFEMLALPGDANDPESSNGHNVVTRVRLPKPGYCFSPTCLAQNIFGFVPEQVVKKVDTNNLPNLGQAPGGMTNTMVKLVDAVNGFLGQYDFLPNLEEEDYESDHSFISVSSAFGMSDDYLFSNIGLALEDDPSLTPFDDVYAPSFANQRHTEVTLENIDYLLSAVLGGEQLLGESLSADDLNGGSFNYSESVLNTVDDVEVHDGGIVKVNAFEPAHFSQANDALPSPNSHFVLSTQSCGAHVVIGNAGSLVLGDTEYGNSAELVIRKDGIVEISEGGSLMLVHGSVIRIQDGGKLILSNGNYRLFNQSRIVVEEGGELHIIGEAPLHLNGPETRLDIYGDIHVHDNSKFSIAHDNYLSGKIIMFRSGHRFHGGASAQMELVGDGASDKIIEVRPNAEFKTQQGFGTLTLKKGLVELHSSSTFHNRNYGVFEEVHFVASDCNDSEIRLWRNSKFDECTIENIPVHAPLLGGIVEVTECSFEGNCTRLNVFNRGYIVRDSQFHDCQGINSSNLSLTSTVDNCYFDFESSDLNTKAISDNSPAMIRVQDCLIQRCGTGVHKRGGPIQLSCNTIRHNATRGVFLGQQCRAYLDADHDSGRNTIVNNRYNIELQQAVSVNFEYGQNFIHSSQEKNIIGTLSGTCANCENTILNGINNHWSASEYIPLGSVPGEPNASDFDVWMLDENCESQDFPGYGCPVIIEDQDPVLHMGCGVHEDSSAEKKNKSGGSSIGIWPVPADQLVYASFADGDFDTWLVIDRVGKRIQEGVIETGATELTIITKDMNSGLYFLVLSGNSTRESLRFAVYR